MKRYQYEFEIFVKTRTQILEENSVKNNSRIISMIIEMK
jgi:hypothetical protein